MIYVCQYCGKECKNSNSLKNHENRCPSNLERSYVNGMTGKHGENQFTKAKDLGIDNPTHSVETIQKIRDRAKNRTHSEETKLKLSIAAKINEFGGHTSKQQIYFEKRNGDVVYLQSSYEIRFAEILESIGVEWSRPNPVIWIDPFGKYHRYYPDFEINRKIF
jgi:hypothetical protein